MTTAFRTAAFTAALLACCAAHADTLAGSGRMVTQERSVPAFTGIALSLPGRLELTQGPQQSVSITAEDNVQPEIEARVEDGKLKLRFTRKFKRFNIGKISVKVTAPAIASLAVAGSGDIVAAGALQSTRLAVSIAGSANVRLASVQAAELVADIGGSGDLSAAGRADALTLNIAGSGNVKAPQLDAGSVKISIAGSGDAQVWARHRLSVSVAGSGDVRYYGDPEVKKAIVGSGSVRRLGASPT